MAAHCIRHGWRESGPVNVLDGVLVIQYVVIDVDARLKGGSVAELLVPRQKTVNLVLTEAVVEHRVIGQDIPVVDIVWQGCQWFRLSLVLTEVVTAELTANPAFRKVLASNGRE